MADLASNPKTDPWNGVIAGLFLALWCVAGWWSVLRNPALVGDDYGLDPGPSLMPTLVLSILTLGAAVILIRGVIGARIAGARPPDLGAAARRAIFPALFVGSLLVYVPLIFQIGFILASSVFAVIWIGVLGLRGQDRGRRTFLLNTGLGTLIGVGLIYIVFVRLIGVPLP